MGCLREISRNKFYNAVMDLPGARGCAEDFPGHPASVDPKTGGDPGLF